MAPVAALALLHVDHAEQACREGAFDRPAAAAGLLVLLPLLAVLTVVVRLESKGPAIFRQERVGRVLRRYSLDQSRLDLRYAENWSLMLDITILWRTVRAVLATDGAYSTQKRSWVPSTGRSWPSRR